MKSKAHRDRMYYRREQQLNRKSDAWNPPYANVGRHHPDYGLHPHVHSENKARRLA